ncbi:hypothetical protein C2G38_2274799 [Gigaspora rosea]|uniref:Uncharacterized protein n=1 Tax=Gigaspora rosea TaxID=44941 RepID=A0A397UJE8_9GLOM|nr:hypothetical protein C2G38_2274799 [Gigaspora rosea]
MTNSKRCMNCETTESTVFRSLKDKKWEEVENNNLTKEKWVKGENPLQRLRREAKLVRISSGEVEVTARKEVDITYKDVGTTIEDMEKASMIDLVGTIEAMTRIFYEREHVNKEGPIYSYEELRESSRQKKERVADAHEKYVEDSFLKNSGNAFVLNIDDYHNIHIPQQADSTNTSRPAHMATIIANPCPVSAIPCNGALNPRIIDDKLIMKHLDERFIINLGIPYNERRLGHTGKCTDDEVIERLTLHSYNDRLVEKKGDRHIQNTILFDFVEGNLKSVENYTNALRIVHDQELMQGYLSDHIIPVVADWPGQFFIRKAIVHQLFLNNEVVPPFVASFVPIMGPLHVSLNGRELVYKKNSFLFNDIYKGIFGKKKNLGKKPRPWRIDLILYLMRVAWLDISNVIYSKFGHTCKNLEFLYLTDLLDNLIPLVLDVYAAHYREGNWQAYEEACMHCCIIRRRTAKFFTASQLQKEARFIFQHRDDNTFRQYFVNSMKYPYKPKQLHILSRKCAVLLLEVFTKIYKARYLYPLTINSSDDNINSYKLPSLGYEITDRHLPRVFACGHGYHSRCLQKCSFKYLICLGYLQDAIKSNVEAIKVSMMKDLAKKEFMDENVESADEDDSDAEDVTGDIATVDNLLDQAKKNFFEL